ncbi:MAG: glycine--tRNA ligase subunit alpha [Acidobacteriia bacterium]|nr:glycine--tRNA ligase subunit alpha [Terriglobia bacterium]
MAKLKKHFKVTSSRKNLSFQDMCLRLSEFWARQGCVIALPYDLEVGAGTMTPETFLRVLGPEPWRVAYLQPSRRPADGRYGDIQDVYLASLADLGIDLRHHDIRFEEDNWEAPTLGAWGIGWQVMLDGLEITQFTYFQQSGGVDLEPISVELTYGMERIAAFLQGVDNVYDVSWNDAVTYGEMRQEEERELSVYDFEAAAPETCRTLFELYEGEAERLLASYSLEVAERFPLRQVYDLTLKCSHLFNILDARGAISVTERVTLIGRVRKLACEVARVYLDRKSAMVEAQPA